MKLRTLFALTVVVAMVIVGGILLRAGISDRLRDCDALYRMAHNGHDSLMVVQSNPTCLHYEEAR